MPLDGVGHLADGVGQLADALCESYLPGHKDAYGVRNVGQRLTVLTERLTVFNLCLPEGVLSAVDGVDRCPHPGGVPISHGSQGTGVGGLVPKSGHFLPERGDLGPHVVQFAHAVQSGTAHARWIPSTAITWGGTPSSNPLPAESATAMNRLFARDRGRSSLRDQ
jgi:hypothetical protein